MWFKNLQIYRFTRPFELTAEALEPLLKSLLFVPCGSQEMSKFGFVSPFGRESDLLVHEAQGQLLLCAKREDKLLPGPVVKDALQERIDQMEADQGRALKKKEKESLKDEVLMQLLPRAFTRTSVITSYSIHYTKLYDFIEASEDTPYFQIGESKYGKPILDRVLTYHSPLDLALQCALISLDSTLRSNLSVGLPLDVLCYRKDSLQGQPCRIGEQDLAYAQLRKTWSEGLARLIGQLPPPPDHWLGND